MKIGQKLITVIVLVMLVFTSVVVLQRNLEKKRLYSLFQERKNINSINFNRIAILMNKGLETYVVENTYWDEMVKAVDTNDTEWFKSTLESSILSVNNYNGVWIFNNDKKQIYSTGIENKGFSTKFPVPADCFDKMLEQKITCHFFIETPKGIMEINGAKIYPGNDFKRQTMPRGYFFAGKLWDRLYITKLSAITSSSISIHPYNEKFTDESNFENGKIFFSHVFYNWNDKPLATAYAINEFSQIKTLNDASKSDIYLFLFFAATLIAFILYFTIKYINLPLKLISDTLKKDDISSVNGLLNEKSEFGDVARLVNNFFKQRNILNEKEEKYRMIFNTANDSILVMRKNKVIDCNEKTLKLYGCTREQIINTEAYLFSPTKQPDGSDSTEKALEYMKTAMTGEAQVFEWVHSRYDQSTFNAEVSLNAFTAGGESYIMAIIRDISERKNAEEELKRLNHNLEETNQELRNFVYIASHDLREPLRKITAFGGILQKNLKNSLSSEDSENLQFMIEGAQRMNKMIEGLLAYSKASTRVHLPQNVDLNVIIEQLQQFELSIALQEKQVMLSIPEPLPHIEVDPIQITQLMQNLIANGIKYQEKNNLPHITITSKPSVNGMVKIEITDNGIGIKPEYLQSIFIMFKRVHTTKEYAGNGIGLAVCKKIVERFGGKIGVESQPGKGSTFWFTVPTSNVLTGIKIS